MSRFAAEPPELEKAHLPQCPNCGERVDFRERHAHHVETHGLDCGPYEHFDDEWLECPNCGGKTDWEEVSKLEKAA